MLIRIFRLAARIVVDAIIELMRDSDHSISKRTARVASCQLATAAAVRWRTRPR